MFHNLKKNKDKMFSKNPEKIMLSIMEEREERREKRERDT